MRIEAGERLREARVQRGLGLADAAARLGLQPKYVRALEWGRYDLLPSPREASEHLRAYVELLGLDGEGLVGDVDAAPAEEPAPRPAPRGARRGGLLGLLGACLLALAGVAAWQLSGDESDETRPAAPVASLIPEEGAPALVEPEAPTPTPVPKPDPPAPKPSNERGPTTLALAAVRGDSWVEARSGSADGSLLYRGNLVQGRSIRLSAPRLWVRIGAASNLDLTLNGRRTGRSLFGTVDVTFGPRGP
jgi:transcriptional regulator with XRE-family HTH domain